jgi:folate-binding protein YgfZ
MTEDYKALTEASAWIDLSARGRLCLIGADRQRFLNGQVTNNVKDLKVGQGCYAALITAKGKMVCDLNVWILRDEILLDFEPGLAEKVIERLEKFIIADDAQIVDASSSYKLISLLGPKINSIGSSAPKLWEIKQEGETYVANLPRLGAAGLDFFAPHGTELKFDAVQASVEAYETVRIERGIPRFGVDMTEETLAPEALDERAISYSKGCYIGQEVIARIRTYGQVAKALRGLRFETRAAVAKAGEKILHEGKGVGWITSATFSPKLNRPIALGYVRKECNQIGTRVIVNDSPAEIVSLPFEP